MHWDDVSAEQDPVDLGTVRVVKWYLIRSLSNIITVWLRLQRPHVDLTTLFIWLFVYYASNTMWDVLSDI